MKNPLGFLAKQEGPLEVVLFVEVLYLLQAPDDLSWFWSHNQKMHTAEDLPRPSTNDTVAIW